MERTDGWIHKDKKHGISTFENKNVNKNKKIRMYHQNIITCNGM